MSRKKTKSKQKIGGQSGNTKKRRIVKAKLKSAPKVVPLAPNKRASPRIAKQQAESESESKSDPRSHLKAFFANYPNFNYDPARPTMDEFYRMCDRTWPDREDPRRDVARNGIRDALTRQFNDIYGTDERSLTAWKELCSVLQLRDIPDELNACRELVRSTYVNIIDLVDARVTKVHVRHFGSEKELSEYTMRTGKYFPKENAYAGGLLKFLLRHIISPSNGKAHSSQWKGNRR
ncbi:hypothetical protein FRC10_006512 [Ceratobasidium sp. 414]|nr:hypothetical protein FRC10_006512 [Ceratobasidium sp. 414]